MNFFPNEPVPPVTRIDDWCSTLTSPVCQVSAVGELDRRVSLRQSRCRASSSGRGGVSVVTDGTRPRDTVEPLVRTHEHLLRILEAYAGQLSESSLIVDAGCGDGRLLRSMRDVVPCRVAGFDSPGYGDFANQAGHEPDSIDVRETNPDGSWPFDDASADIVVSNQVLEHVADLDQFCAEAGRISRDGAVGVHVFPVRQVVIEPHLELPLVHRIRDHDLRASAIRTMAWFGLGKFDADGIHRGTTLDEYAQAHADYVRTHTSYRSWREVAATFEHHGFRVSRRYSSMFLRSLFQTRPGPLPAVVESAFFPLASRVSSITLLTERRDSYRYRGPANT